MIDAQQDLRASLVNRQYFANQLEAHFKAHPLVWISILDLQKIGGPSWRSRIADDLRTKRKLNVVWNRESLESKYRYEPHDPLGRDAGTFVPFGPATDAPYQEPPFVLTAPEAR